MSRRPSNWYDMGYDEQRAWQRAETEREDLKYDRDRERERAERAEAQSRRQREESRRQMQSERESAQESYDNLSTDYNDVCEELEAVKSGLGLSLDWLEHPAVHDAFRNDPELYAKLSEHIEATRVALGRNQPAEK